MATADSAPPAGRRARPWLDAAFGVDLRSLALWRIALAGVLLVDLADRSRFLVAHYTELGALPTELLVESFGRTSWLGIHAWLSGSPAAVAGLFGVNALALLALLVGWRTRWVTPVCWYLLSSLHLRNPWVSFGGDSFVAMQMLWAIFLPTGARFSLDARRRARAGQPPPADAHVSWATAAILIQIFFVYFVTGMHKDHPRWIDGRALWYTLNLDQYATAWTHLLREQTWLHAPLTHGSRWLEILGPCLLFVPWRTGLFRMLAWTAFVGFHLGLAVFMSIGLFPAFSICAWTVVLPGVLWDRWLPALLGRGPIAPGTGPRLRSPRWLAAVVPVLVGYLVLHHAADLRLLPFEKGKLPGVVHRFGSVFRMNQRWRMFKVPNPNDYWMVTVGRLADGTRVDPFHRRPPSFEKPEVVPRLFPGFRWRLYTWRALHSRDAIRDPEPRHRAFAHYLCRRWNASHPPERALVSLRSIVVVETTHDTRVDPPEPRELWAGRCDDSV